MDQTQWEVEERSSNSPRCSRHSFGTLGDDDDGPAFLLGSLGRTLQEGIDEHEILFLIPI